MKTSIEHLPSPQQAELKSIVDAIRADFKDVEMIVLYGSFARGNFVNDLYEEKGIIYEYRSDYDLLIIFDANAAANNETYKFSINSCIKALNLSTPASPIYHGIDFVNSQLSDGNYFFNEIRSEGVLLYNSGKFNLANKRKLNLTEIKAKAEKDFKNWFNNASEFHIGFYDFFNRDSFNTAAFMLHQSAERYYNTVQLVFTGYKPKSHNIEDLGKNVCGMDIRFIKVFPCITEEEKYRFTLLKRAYIDARYDMDYIISKEELEYLNERVILLKNLTEEICKEKIENYGKTKNSSANK